MFCPLRMSLSEKLPLMKERIENGSISIERSEKYTICVNGFSSMWELYNYLVQNAPEEDLAR